MGRKFYGDAKTRRGNGNGDGPAVSIAAFPARRTAPGIATLLYFISNCKKETRGSRQKRLTLLAGTARALAGKSNTRSHCIAFAYAVTPLRTSCFKVYILAAENTSTRFNILCFRFTLSLGRGKIRGRRNVYTFSGSARRIDNLRDIAVEISRSSLVLM